MAELQPALIRLKEQLRDLVAAGHTLDETQRVIALRGIFTTLQSRSRCSKAQVQDENEMIQKTYTGFRPCTEPKSEGPP